MKNLIQSITLLCLPFLGIAQNALFNNGATLVLKSSAILFVKGNFQNQSGSTLTNNGDLKITGNITNNATMTVPNSGTLSIIGTNPQTISGSATYFAKNVFVNNASGITLNTPLKIDGNANFNNGIIVSSTTNPVHFTANGTHSSTSNPSHVNGAVLKEGTGAFDYPVGDGTFYQKISTNLSANSAGLLASYSPTDAGSGIFTTGGTEPTLLQSYNQLEHWNIAPIGSATGTVTVYWDAIKNIGIGNISDLKVAHLSAGNWLNEGNLSTGSTAAGSVTSNNINTWSPFTLGSVNLLSSPLPISLTSFKGRAQNKANVLEWSTSSEQNNKGFNLQHSANNLDFKNLGFILGSNGNTSKNYAFTHSNPFAGVNYYRLQQIDLDGKSSFSKTISIDNKLNGSIVAKPNPSNGVFTFQGIDFSGNDEKISYQLIDLLGKKIDTKVNSNTLDIRQEPNGIYYLQILQNGTIIQTTKLVKN